MKYGVMCIGLVTLVLGSGSAEAQMRHGLWEFTNTQKSSSNSEMDQTMKEMEQEMAQMPPEERKIMENRGMSISSEGISYKICITKTDAEAGLVPQQQNECKQNIIRTSGNTSWIKFDCGKDGPRGEGEYTFDSDTSFTIKSTVYIDMGTGKEEAIKSLQTAKWLSDDCGTIKPFTH